MHGTFVKSNGLVSSIGACQEIDASSVKYKTKLNAKAWFDFKARSQPMVGIGNKIWKNFGAKVGEAKQVAYVLATELIVRLDIIFSS